MILRVLRQPLAATLVWLLCVHCMGETARATIVQFQTSSGNVNVRLYNTATPNSVVNFMNYVTSNRYSGTFIHRVPQVKDQFGNNIGTQHFVVQGGGFLLNNSIWAASGISTFSPIGDEPGISNTRGTLAFAKNGLGATSQWFFNVGDNSALNASNFTVFGRVLGSGMSVIDTIDNLSAINASAAENAPGEDFDEIPVRDVAKVIAQNDITSNEAVMVNVVTLNYKAGDYDFNGTVNNADYTVWRNSFGSTTLAEADGNGNGKVDAADYVLWRKTFGQSGGPATGPEIFLGANLPEPSSGILLLLGAWMAVGYRRRLTTVRRAIPG